MPTHQDSVRNQFDPQAQAYLRSAVHAGGADLARARTLVEQAIPGTGRALDIGCGPGHLSFALAPALASVIAFDPSPSMLATVAQAAATRGLTQIEGRQGQAESLPFADASFDLICTRYSAHHWRRLEAGLGEARRVLRPRGYLLVIDGLGHEDALADTHLQAIELLRDPSHVRDRTVTEWRRLLAAAGFAELEHSSWTLRLEFAAWVERMRTPSDRVAIIRSMQADAPREVREALAIGSDGSFNLSAGLFWARFGGSSATMAG